MKKLIGFCAVVLGSLFVSQGESGDYHEKGCHSHKSSASPTVAVQTSSHQTSAADPLKDQNQKRKLKKRDEQMKTPRLECTLVVKQNKVRVGDYPSGEVAIKNVSQEYMLIEYDPHPFEHLDLQVVDAGGKRISGIYRHIFSIQSKGQLLLRPGETYRSGLAIFSTVDPAILQSPGSFKITAVYEYKNEKAISKQVELVLMAK